MIFATRVNPFAQAARLLMAASVLLAACNGGEPTKPAPVLTTVSVSLTVASIQVRQTTAAGAVGLDQNGAAIGVGTVVWSSGAPAVATVSADGIVTGVTAGQAQIIASSGGKQGQATLTVTPAPVSTVTVTPPNAPLVVGATLQLTATARDAAGNALAGRPVAWTTSDATKATVNTTGLVTAIAVGTSTITATSEEKFGSAAITVTSGQQATCTASSALALTLGEVRALTAAQVASLCLGGTSSASEYVLIPFSNSNVAASALSVQIVGTNTTPILGPTLSVDRNAAGDALAPRSALPDPSMEWAFRQRERRELNALRALAPNAMLVPPTGPSRLTGIPTTPTVGAIVQLNANLNAAACAPKQLRPARIVAVLPHTIVIVDTLAPAGGYTDAELTAFGTGFDTLGFAMDTLNFGVPSDMDGNGRIAIFFTPGVNEIPGPPGSIIGGLFYGRDLFPATGTSACAGSNEGEMFYMPVPDPNSTINANYTNKARLSNGVLGTLVHEFQHLINAGRRLFVNAAPTFEEVWLNEGLSHIAEELLYYRMSGNSPRSNITLSLLLSSQAQKDAFNSYSSQNFGRLSSYLQAPSANSPFSQVDGLGMRGAIWQLLRYSSDRKGGAERAAWYALVNSTTSGQANFNAVFGDIITMTRDWAVAQFVDHAGLPVPAKYTHPSWDFRGIYAALTMPSRFPIATSPLVSGSAVSLTLSGGAPAYVRFQVGASVFATVASSSAGQPVPATVDFILVRTQ